MPKDFFQKAVEKGIVSANAKISHEDKLNLIFAAGFSTAEQLTDVSGRGVGMDVVRQAVDSLGGNIKIDSKLGEGTTFIISLPTSVSIVDALKIKLGEEDYLVPIQDLDEAIDLGEYKKEIL